MASTLPLLYTHVMGSHGFPSWFWTALDRIKAGEYGQTDVRETFDGHMDGLEALEPLRKTGLYAYDSVPRYRATRKVTVPKGLGTVDEFKYLVSQTDKPIKATCPGPVTLSIHIQT